MPHLLAVASQAVAHLPHAIQDVLLAVALLHVTLVAHQAVVHLLHLHAVAIQHQHAARLAKSDVALVF